ncbi:MAG: 50S ribosomal protein L11 methyltransferase [Leptolyngbyaceae cyanobacterium CSU_1_4]|nr:50S ribosomal protein L11 methyltransferase [Leptolyngbyaceae cyanobacterium CSU_1_4]
MPWMELSLDTTSEAVDWVCTLLAGTGYRGKVEIVECPPDSGSHWAFTLYLYLPQAQAQAQAQEIADVLLPLHRTGIATELQVRIVEDLAAAKSSQAVSSPRIHRVGDRFVILSESDELSSSYSPAPHELTLQIKTSLAFGSGLHPATQLSLRLLEKHITSEMKTLDLGSGSGILSVAIAKLGAQVLAIDNDAIAVQATQDALQRNGVVSQATVLQGSLGQGSQLGHWMGGKTTDESKTLDAISDRISASDLSRIAPFDLIVANILARVHITLAPDFRRALIPSGLLITAGFTTDYEAAVASALGEEGFEAVDCERLQEWVAWMYRLNP